MDIDFNKLTFEQLREIANMFGSGAQSAEPHPFAGKYVICRCTGAGVHAGELVSQSGDQVILKNSRRLWSWKALDGVALSGLAIHGLESGKVDTLVPEIALLGVVEIIPCSDIARETIHGAL